MKGGDCSSKEKETALVGRNEVRCDICYRILGSCLTHLVDEMVELVTFAANLCNA